MAQEEIKYTIPSDGTNDGRQVDLVVTYDPSTQNADGSYTATSASGTYEVLDNSGNVTKTDTITSIAAPGGQGGNDNELFLSSDPSTTPIVNLNGISFNISDPTDSNDTNSTDANYGQVNFFYDSNNQYLENGANSTAATNVTETAAPCFASCTDIRTLHGDVAVEHLSVGDVLLTASGAHRPIRWLGHRTIDCRRHPRPHEVMPIEIAAHAFGEGRPARNLRVSPGHAICVDVVGEVLIPAESLVNGATIRQVAVDEVTYWHVELDSHDVLLAENLPAESYLDMGNRGFFAEAEVVGLAAGPDADPASRTHADFCRPFHGAGALVEVVKAQLAAHVEAMGWSLTTALALHLEVDGRRVEPVVRGPVARFHVPVDAKEVWLVSPTAQPRETMVTGDSRDLGLCVASLCIDDGLGSPRDIALGDPLLCVGFHALERGCLRWTAGRALLPAALWDGCEDDFFLRVTLAAGPVPRWERARAASPVRLAASA